MNSESLTIEQIDTLLQKAYTKLDIALDAGAEALMVALSKTISELLALRDRHFMSARIAPPQLGNAFMGTRSAPAPAPTMTAADRKLQRAMNAPCMGMDDE